MNEKQRVIKKIQAVELDAVKAFQKVCQQHGISFYLRGGSVMGAVKYKGFIPWDDDVDIAVPRPEYDKIKLVFKDRIIAGKYRVESYHYNENLHCYFPRLFLLEEERQRLGLPRNTHLGLHLIDILPLDGAPGNALMRQLYFLQVYAYRFLASLGTNYHGDHLDMHSNKQKIVIAVFKKLGFAKLFKQTAIYRKLDRLYSKNHWQTSPYSGTITASLFKREVMPTEIWGQGQLLDFEDSQFRVPSDYDNYLKRMYGDNYLTYEPSDEEKKSHIQLKEKK